METPSKSCVEHKELQTWHKLVVNLVNRIDSKELELRLIENKYEKICVSLSRMVEERNQLSQFLSCMIEEKNKASQFFSSKAEEKNKLSQDSVEETREMRNLVDENKKLKLELESLKKELIQQETREMQNLVDENKKLKLELESLRNEPIQQGKSKLQSLKRKFQDSGSEEDENDCNIRRKKEGSNQEMTDENEETESLEYLNQVVTALTVQEHISNSELQEARKALITGLQGLCTPRSLIGIKRLGELDQKQFKNACQNRFSFGEADVKSVELCSLWQQHINNPQWHPFKSSRIGGKDQETIDEDDELLKELKDEWGDEVYRAVTEAMLELNDCNPSGRYPVQELWNLKERRKASLKEGIHYILMRLKMQKRRK